MEWPEFDGYGYTTSIVGINERKEILCHREGLRRRYHLRAQIGTLVKLGEWFEARSWSV